MTAPEPNGADLPADGSADRSGPRHARPRRKDPLDIRLAVAVPTVLVAAFAAYLLVAGAPADKTLGPVTSKATTALSPRPTLSPVGAERAVVSAQASPQGSARPHSRPAPRQHTTPRGRLTPKAMPRRAPGSARSSTVSTPLAPAPSTPAPTPPASADGGTETTSPKSPLGYLLDLLRRRK